MAPALPDSAALGLSLKEAVPETLTQGTRGTDTRGGVAYWEVCQDIFYPQRRFYAGCWRADRPYGRHGAVTDRATPNTKSDISGGRCLFQARYRAYLTMLLRMDKFHVVGFVAEK